MAKKKREDVPAKEMIGVRVPPETDAAINYIHQRDGGKKSDVIRRLIEVGITIDRQFADRQTPAA